MVNGFIKKNPITKTHKNHENSKKKKTNTVLELLQSSSCRMVHKVSWKNVPYYRNTLGILIGVDI